jgi:hypothetical protein
MLRISLSVMFSLLLSSLVGCASASDSDALADRSLVEALPEVERVHSDAAVDVVVEFYGMGGAAPVVHWVEQVIELGGGVTALGVAFEGCEVWVYYASPRPDIISTSDSPVFGSTALAHELAHCALEAAVGDPDSDHERADWWLAGGMVDGARGALHAAGF